MTHFCMDIEFAQSIFKFNNPVVLSFRYATDLHNIKTKKNKNIYIYIYIIIILISILF